MKNKPYVLGCLALIICFFSIETASAQVKKTIVLVRHVEKDDSSTADKVDPEISDIGRQRAQRLVQVLKKYKPREIYSTNFKRTRHTAGPIAASRKIDIQTYDAGKQNDLVAKIMASRSENVLVIGHSNSTPLLANLLIKKEVFKQVPDTEFGVIWVIEMKNGAAAKVEVFSY